MKRRPREIRSRLVHVIREVFLLPLHAYRYVISPNLRPRCRYYPSCSSYGLQAVRELGIFRGTIVAGWRVMRCNPFSDGGVDELADRRLFPEHGHDHTHAGNGVAS